MTSRSAVGAVLGCGNTRGSHLYVTCWSVCDRDQDFWSSKSVLDRLIGPSEDQNRIKRSKHFLRADQGIKGASELRKSRIKNAWLQSNLWPVNDRKRFYTGHISDYIDNVYIIYARIILPGKPSKLYETEHPDWVLSLKLGYDVKLRVSGDRSDRAAKRARRARFEADSKTSSSGMASGNSIEVQTTLTHSDITEMEDGIKSLQQTSL